VRRIVLADGTRVTLNRHSTLSYNDRREAELGGEAYFEVAKGPSGEPFTVRSGQLTVTVMGTEFNLRAHKEEDSSTLSLYEGRVQLDCAGGTHLLEEGGHEFMLDHSTGQFVVREFDPEARPEWMEDETPICRCSCLHL
jgi:ferric-dicitrate binding protein FerR (iron transport regulator)